MKTLKKFVAIFLAGCMNLAFLDVNFAKEIQPGSSSILEDIDALLIASSFLNAPDAENDILKTGTLANEVIHLYNEKGDVVALYTSFEPTGYAIVNNNKENPTIIEFGKGENRLIENILSDNPMARIVYNNQVEVYEYGKMGRNSKTSKDIYDYYPDLKEKNQNLSNQLKYLREYVSSKYIFYGNNDYGFIDWHDMPTGDYTFDLIDDAVSVDWAITKDFESIAENHCGATAVTNIALYFAEVGYSNLKINTVYDTFVEVHKIVGDGPTMTIADKAKTFFSDRGYTLKTGSVGSFSSVKSAIEKNHPCGVLLGEAIDNWHWIICVGYRDYGFNGKYMRIVNGWDDTTGQFYLCNSDSIWWSSTEYWVN